MFQESAINCNSIILLHNHFNTTPKSCNNGTIIGQGLTAEGNCYTSRLSVESCCGLVGSTIEYHHDNGSATKRIGSFTIPNTTITVTSTGSNYNYASIHGSSIMCFRHRFAAFYQTESDESSDTSSFQDVNEVTNKEGMNYNCMPEDIILRQVCICIARMKVLLSYIK